MAALSTLETDIIKLKGEMEQLLKDIGAAKDDEDKKWCRQQYTMKDQRLGGLEKLYWPAKLAGAVGDAKSAAPVAPSDNASAAAFKTPNKQHRSAAAVEMSPFGAMNNDMPPQYNPDEDKADTLARRAFVNERTASVEELSKLVLRPRVRDALHQLLAITTSGTATAGSTATATNKTFATESHKKLLAVLHDDDIRTVMADVAADSGSGELGLEKVYVGPWTLLLLLREAAEELGSDAEAATTRWFCGSKKIHKTNSEVDILPDGQICITTVKERVPLLTQETKPIAAARGAVVADAARLLHSTLVAAEQQMLFFHHNALLKKRTHHLFCRLPLLVTLMVADQRLTIGVYTHSRVIEAVDAATKAADVAAKATAAAAAAAEDTGRGARNTSAKANKAKAEAEATAKEHADAAKRVRRVYLLFPELHLNDHARIAKAFAQVSQLMLLASSEIICASPPTKAVGSDFKTKPTDGGGGGGNGDDETEDDSTEPSPLKEGRFSGGRRRTDSGNTTPPVTTNTETAPKSSLTLQTIVEGDENTAPPANASTAVRTVAGADKPALKFKPHNAPLQRRPEQQRHFGTELAR